MREIAKPSRIGVRLAVLGVVAGLAIVIGFFASNTVVAFLGFAARWLGGRLGDRASVPGVARRRANRRVKSTVPAGRILRRD